MLKFPRATGQFNVQFILSFASLERSPDDDEALAMLGPPTLARLTTDEQYGPFYGTEAMVGGDQMEPGAYAMPTEQQTGMPLDNMVGLRTRLNNIE